MTFLEPSVLEWMKWSLSSGESEGPQGTSAIYNARITPPFYPKASETTLICFRGRQNARIPILFSSLTGFRAWSWAICWGGGGGYDQIRKRLQQWSTSFEEEKGKAHQQGCLIPSGHSCHFPTSKAPQRTWEPRNAHAHRRAPPLVRLVIELNGRGQTGVVLATTQLVTSVPAPRVHPPLLVHCQRVTQPCSHAHHSLLPHVHLPYSRINLLTVSCGWYRHSPAELPQTVVTEAPQLPLPCSMQKTPTSIRCLTFAAGLQMMIKLPLAR